MAQYLLEYGLDMYLTFYGQKNVHSGAKSYNIYTPSVSSGPFY